MGQRCCRCSNPKEALQLQQAAAQATTSPLGAAKTDTVASAMPHPHRSMAGDLITCGKARKLDIRDAAIEDYVHL
tara:strand:- start:1112 stop:1336 length:225 start_codon:yes stop_codon:yes gene_type:complete